jgi:hypothetical protein
VNSTTYPHLVSRLRINDATPLLVLYDSMGVERENLPFHVANGIDTRE